MTVYKLENLSFKQIDALDRQKTIVILPCGSMEQHGPHLPNGMDTHLAVAISEKAAENVKDTVDCLILPAIPVGQSPEHIDYPGTLSFTAETFIRILKEISGSIARHGFTKMYIVNGHGGNISAIGAAAFDIRDQYKIRIFMFNVWAVVTDLAAKLTQREAPHKTDAHGGEIETSLVMYTHPEQVHMEWAVDEDNPLLARGELINLGGPIGFNWNSVEDVALSGISGKASFGSAEKGKILIEALVDMATKGLLEIDRNW